VLRYLRGAVRAVAENWQAAVSPVLLALVAESQARRYNEDLRTNALSAGTLVTRARF
jgi:hypothetical protein